MENLKGKALEIRTTILDMLYNAKSGHPGGSLSIVEILTVLYYKHLDLNLDENGNRIDKLILSKGHAAPALYAVLSDKGYIKKSELKKLRKSNSILEGHPSNKIEGIDASSGSLGQGLSIASGFALANKIDKKKGYTYCILGDGEIQEGQIWEASMTINKYNLNNLIVFLDNNGLQIDGTIKEVKRLTDLDKKFKSFGFNVLKVDGHSLISLDRAIKKAKKSNKATIIIAKTVKGKGVSFMENNHKWHGKAMTEDEYNLAHKELKRG